MSFTTLSWSYPSPSTTTATATATTSGASTAASLISIVSPTASPPLKSLPPQSTSSATPTATAPIGTTIITTTPAAIAASSTKKKRSTMPMSALELRQEDDWTKVKDPKEKKRIQNRVAQRTYRHRMKARLGELQARLDSLDSHERLKLQQTTRENSDSSVSTSNGVVPGIYTNTSQIPGCESSPSPISSDKTSSGQVPVMQSSMYDQAIESTETPIFSHAAERLLDSPPQTHPSPQPHGLLSPPGQPAAERTPKVSQDFVLDCMRFQTQLLNKLNNLQQESNFGPSYSSGNDVPSLLDDMTQAEQAQCVNDFTSSNNEGMEFTFDTHVEWKADSVAGKMESSPSSSDALNFPKIASATPTPSSMGPAAMDSTPPVKSKTATLNDRFESIMEHVQAAGFDSFDDLVTAYYSDTFGEASPLANEQRLSRNRRLPKVIWDVFQATSQWTSWERRGFQEEILKTAESMLISEGTNARPSLMSKIAPLIETHDSSNPAATADALLNLKRSIQNEVPNSWALTMALAAENRNSWQRDRSNTALATTLLLNFCGRIPNDQLLQILGACL